jgi:hypothetical protein
MAAALTVLTAMLGCSTRHAPREKSSAAPAAFTNRVWVVAESEQVARGDLRVFLSEGTLVMASPHATPALGTWSYKDGQLMITEESRPYSVDILELTPTTFRIRIHSPGEPVVIRFAPA